MDFKPLKREPRTLGELEDGDVFRFQNESTYYLKGTNSNNQHRFLVRLWDGEVFPDYDPRAPVIEIKGEFVIREER